MLIKQLAKRILKFLLLSMVITVFSITVFFIVAPFAFLDFKDFKNNFEYEGGLAAGNFSVFYTRQFINTIPVLFQLTKILPYSLGLFLLIIAIFGFFVAIINLIKKPKANMFLIIISFLSLFLVNAFLFAKWTRFIAPTFPFFSIFAAYFLEKIYLKNKLLSKIITYVLLLFTALWTLAFYSIYLKSDIRIIASDWMVKNFPINSTILIEGGNMIDVPLNGTFNRIGFDFYDIEGNLSNRLEIAMGLSQADYFLVQSRRVFMNHQRLPTLFPITANFYDSLFNGKLGFTQIKEFHSYPTLTIGNLKLEFSDEKAEETWSVFDHPVIRVFKKTIQLSTSDYEKILDKK